MIRLLLGFCFLGSVCFSQAKLTTFRYLSDTLHGHGYIDVGAIFSSVRDNRVPNPKEQRLSAWSLNLEYSKINFNQGGYQYTGRIKMFMDVVFTLNDALTKTGAKAINRSTTTSLTSGILGWHSMRWNLVAEDNFCLGLGINASDYFYGASYENEKGKLFTPEPNGYYLGGGPTLSADYRINHFMKLGLLVDYTFSAIKAVGISYGEKIEGFPLPHFLNSSFNVTTKWGAFFKCDFNTILNVDNAPTKGQRTDFWFGFKFVLR